LERQLQSAGKTPSEKDIDRLAAKAAGGDAGAFGELYDIHVDRIYRHIYYRVGNTGDAEDLTQQVFINAWKAIGRYRKKSVPFSGWLMTISRNLMIDFYRERKEKVSLDERYETASRDPGPERLAEINTEHRKLLEAISRLPEEHRRVIVMKFIEDSGYREIAAALNKSEGAVRVMVHRALKDIRARMEKGSGP
jgi:RNA polymerase sigma-70 factor (ECF subfamily)